MSNRKILPFEATHQVRDHCLCLAVQRAARALARRFDDAMRSMDLTHGQFSLLMSLNRPHPPTIGEVAHFLAMDRTTLTANIKPLARRGLLKVAIDKEDKRSRRLTLSPAGHALLIDALPVWKETHAAIDALLVNQKPDHLRKVLALLA
jgi:DNA-binding MarR family transcriptional regulator